MYSELRWFFSAGMAAFEKSRFGLTLERQLLFRTARAWCDESKLTARPRSTRQSGEQGYEPELETLCQCGDIGRRLEHVRAHDPGAREALELFYGNEGELWARHERGRLVALFPMTRTGRTLLAQLRRAATPAQLELSDNARLAIALASESGGGPRSTRAALINAAQCEALELSRRADAAWASSAAPRRVA